MVDRDTISEVMRELGRRGGKVGGKRRLQTMTKEERSAIARKAGLESAAARAKKAVAAREAKRAREKTAATDGTGAAHKAAAKKTTAKRKQAN